MAVPGEEVQKGRPDLVDAGHGNPIANFGDFSEPLLDSRNRTVQKLCLRIIGLPPCLTVPLKAVAGALTDLGRPCFLSHLFETVTSGEIGLKRPAPKEQPPRKLSGKRTV